MWRRATAQRRCPSDRQRAVNETLDGAAGPAPHERGPQLLTVARAECHARTPPSEAGPSHDPGRDGDDQEAHDQAGPKDGVFVALAPRLSFMRYSAVCKHKSAISDVRL